MHRSAALFIAERTRAALAPYCRRIEIAGSVRRGKPEVKDIELVAMPNTVPTGLFGDELVTDPGFCAVVNQWPAVKGTPEGKYAQRRLPEGIVLDLFMADSDNWGLIFAMRTGSATFSHHVLAAGWVKAGYTSSQGYLHRRGQRVPVREEADLFSLLGIPWVAPEAREV
jgi:DNA polymerase/3'-5' exonuclease PolX